VPESVKLLYEKHNKKKSSPSISDLSEALQSVLSDYARAFIVIDALAEYQDPRTLLSKISKLQADTGANLFTISQPIEKIKKEIKKEFKESVVLEIRAADGDVGKYLDGHMSKLPVLDEGNEELSEEIKTNIKTKIKAKIIKVFDGV